MENYIVFLKQIPASTKIKIDPQTNTLVRSSGATRTNPDDLHALQAALWLREQHGGKGDVIAVTMGPPSAKDVLIEALAHGADRAVLVSDRAFAGSDTWCTALVLASVAKKIGGYKALFFGVMALDGDTAQVGPETAALLDLPQITSLVGIDKSDADCLWISRNTGGYHQELKVKMPAVVMVSKFWAKMPHLNLNGWRRAQTIEIEVEDAASLGIDPRSVGLNGSPTRVVETYVPSHQKDIQIIASVEELKNIIEQNI